MKTAEITGRALYYLFGALSIIGILNFPIQIIQLILLGKLTFPTFGLPFEIPFYLVIILAFAAMILGLLIAGYFWAKWGIAKHQNQVMNENNPQMLEVLERLKRIEHSLNIQENEWK